MSKQWRRPRTYVALGLTMLVPIIIVIALKANPPSQPRDVGDTADAFFYLATKTGLFLPVAALRVMSRFLLVIVVALFAGDAIASEASWGNLRALLVRPIGRGRLLGVQARRGRAARPDRDRADRRDRASSPAASGSAGTRSAPRCRFGPSSVAGPSTAALDRATSASRSLYVFWSLSSVIAFAFMVSTMTDSPAGAVFAALRPLRVLADPRRHHVARIDPLRAPDPLLRRVGRAVPAQGRIQRTGHGQPRAGTPT